MSTFSPASADPRWHWLKPDLQVVDFWLSRCNALWSTHEARARVVAVIPEADGVSTVVLKPNRHFKGFRPGQHVNVSVEIDGIRHTRSYSLSDAPRPDKLLRVTVKAVEGGKVSRYLQAVRRRAVVHLSQAFGDFELPMDNAPVVLMAAGSGITPMLSLLKAQAAMAFPRPVLLACWARNAREWVQAETLRDWMAKHANFKVHLIATREKPEGDAGLFGRISKAHIDTLFSGLPSPHVLVCGPSGFVGTARERVAAWAKSFQAESFTPPVQVVAPESEGTVQVTLQRSGRTLEVARGATLLEALEAQGVNPAFGCRMGICNTCACGKSSGVSRDVLNGELGTEPTHALRLCISAAQSDLTLEL